ncbi:MAG: hypothetical protein AAGH74_13295 [Pseudomonadota bacterium]
MKKAILISILIISFGIAGYTFYESWRLQDPEYQRQQTIQRNGMLETPLTGRQVVNLDQFVTETKPHKQGTREIVPPTPIAFTGTIKREPEAIKTEYVYTALTMMEVAPLPQVNYRMFVETEEGRILPVYVWDNAVAAMTASGVTGEPVALTGFHVYTYSKGPAIIVDAVI